MGVGYILVNYSKKELISFNHIGANKARELAGNPVSAAMITWYMLQHKGDTVAFLSDTYGEWCFPEGTRDEISDYRDVTDEVVKSLIEVEILIDLGKTWVDSDEPDKIYIRALENVWMKF